MQIFRGYSALPARHSRPVVAIGNFDGVHRGHVHVFDEARRLAHELGGGAQAVVLTFDPHPAKVLAPSFAPPLITTEARKLELIAEAGIDVTVVQPFDRAFAAKEPAAFVDEVLVGGLGARRVCVGHDFTFGTRRSGDTHLLAELGATRGFDVVVVPPFSIDGMVCSSTKVREFVLEGRVDGAAVILGRDPEVEGVVVRGDGRGRSIGIPTANLRTETELVPKNGVYAGWAGEPGGPTFAAAINIGTTPTFKPDHPVTVEAHLLDADLDLYGRSLRVGFMRRLRAEERFESVDKLVAQIRRDIEATRAVWDARHSAHGQARG
jgi:riboflavin kinase/FMN adenylyltransferase